MKKRPLCRAVLLVLGILWLLPAELWMKKSDSAGEDTPSVLTGEVWKLEKQENGQAVYLKHSNLSHTGVILVYFEAEHSISIGNTLQIYPPYSLQKPEPARNPGQFDAKVYYQTAGIEFICYAKNAEVTKSRVLVIPQLVSVFRSCLGERLDAIFERKEAGVMKAMLLGDKTTLMPEIKNLYQKTGMSHLLSVSGLHVTLVGVSLYRFLQKIGVSCVMSAIPSLGAVLFYGSLTGMRVSTLRAVLMFALTMLADILGKSYDMLTSLALAALLLLAEQPLQAQNAAFLLSFGAVLGIGLLYPVLEQEKMARTKMGKAWLFSFSVQIMTLPLIQYFYYEYSVYAILLNILVIPWMSLLMPAGILAVFVSFFSAIGAKIPALVCKGILILYEWLGNLVLELPGSVFICGQPKIGQMVIYYLGIAVFVFWRCRIRQEEKWMTKEEKERQEKKRQKRNLRDMLFLLLLCLLLTLRINRECSFTMLDMGQGECLFLRTAQGTTCLIDGGSTDIRQVGTHRILPFLKAKGVRNLDYVFISHTDTDHISGIWELLEASKEPGSVRIHTLVLSGQAAEEEAGKELIRLAQNCGTQIQLFAEGMCVKEEKLEIRCLYPEREKVYEDKNEGSLVLQIVYGEFSMILAGDLTAEGEEQLLKIQKEELDCDVLKVAHHGSGTSTSEEWLTTLRPEVALISCGKNNPYGHPHRETLEKLKKAHAVVFDTSACGAITIHSNGKQFSISRYISE